MSLVFRVEDWATMVSLTRWWCNPEHSLTYPPHPHAVCYVSPPPYMLADIQVNAEYIAYAITAVAAASHKNGGPVAFPLMAWSQGNLAISWTLTFWPSTRQYISNYISFAGDFGGCALFP